MRFLESHDESPAVRLEIDLPECSRRDVPEWCVHKGSWYCPFRIVQGTQIVNEGVALGGDAISAILNAVQHLRYRYRKSGLRACYNEYTEPSGLPFYVPNGLGRRFDRRVERAVKGAIDSLVREDDLKRERAKRSRQPAKRKPRD